ncbi:NIN-like protein [Artemisia annua]|uniref:NIN-like protein n=1 Tax=Artemisia annua TaxID=35608 RepID=A0A2U1PIQ5_ARTAN|nr:NIN-like protein [Artemisia annua]
MDLCPHIQSVDSSDESKTSGFASDCDMKLALDISTPVVPSESRYLTRLMVYGNEDELSRSESSQSSKTSGSELRTYNIDPHNKIIQDKIRAALKFLTFREQHVLVQFWSPRVVGKHQLLTSIDQPFGLGVLDERLLLYRKDSVHSSFVVDMNDEDEDTSPIARVFRRGLPEWTSDVTNYLPKDFPQQECAIRCNLNGYLALPVFDSDVRSCVGVIELLTSSKYSSFAYEVQQVESALKTTKLTTAQAFDSPSINVHYEQRQNELQRILSILKAVCETHQLPLAQTWAVSPLSSFASHEEVLKMTCNSFDIRCLGKTCMSTASLPFYVPDLGLWSFRKACREQHVDKACGLVGRALLSCGSCFCGNVTKLSEEEYPLVHNAQMSGLTSCFAIFLHSIESNDDYVLEFFLSLNRDDGKHVHNLVQTLKENIEIAYGFELGDTSSIQVVGPPTEASLFLYTGPQRTINSCITTAKTNILETVSSDSESFVGDVAKTNSTYIVNQLPSKQELFNNNGATMITSTEILSLDDIERDNVNVACKKDNDNVMYDHDVSMHMTNVGEKSNSLKQGSKRKLYSLTMEAAEKHVGKPTDEAANSLGGKSSYLQRTSIEQFGLSSVVFLLLRIKRWSCLSKHHEFSGKWWLCGKHSYLPFKLDSVYQVAQVLLSLKRWRNRKSSMHAIHNRDHPTVFESIENPKYKPNIIKPYCYVNWKLAESSLVYASPKHTVASVISDAKKVTVKATYKGDMIKFQFPTSLGLFELENEVAERINLKSKRIFLKYRDEDDDLILLACDADLRSLLGSSTSNNSVIKLIIVLADE